jgi:hypothetical protein
MEVGRGTTLAAVYVGAERDHGAEEREVAEREHVAERRIENELAPDRRRIECDERGAVEHAKRVQLHDRQTAPLIARGDQVAGAGRGHGHDAEDRPHRRLAALGPPKLRQEDQRHATDTSGGTGPNWKVITSHVEPQISTATR